MVGVGHTECGPGLARREGAQADPVRQIGLQTAQPPLFEALRGEQQMDAQRTPDASDLYEHLDEVGLGGQQFAELVDDQDERGDGLQRGSRGARLLVVVDVGVVAGIAQHLLAAVEFTADGVTHPVHQRQIVREVGDHRRDVGHLRHAGEGGTALEVREDEVECLRGVGDGQAEDERTQQFGLAGAGGADAQTVRPHPFLRRLLEVQHHGGAVLADADRDTQPLRLGAGPPGPADVDRGRVTEVQQIGEFEVGEQRLVVVPARGHMQRCQLPGQCLGGFKPEQVGEAVVDQPVPGLQLQGVRVHHDGQAAARTHDLARYDLDDGHPLEALGRGERRHRRHGPAVEHDDDMRLVHQRLAIGLEARPAFEPAREQVLQLADARGDQTADTGTVDGPRYLDVRKPLRPFPERGRVPVRRDGDDQVLGGVQ